MAERQPMSLLRRVQLAGGVTAAAFGFLLLVWPRQTLTVVSAGIAVLVILAGVSGLVGAISWRSAPVPLRAVQGVFSAFATFVGVLALMNASASAWFIATVFGVFIGFICIVDGLNRLRMAGLAASPGWVRVRGILGILLGVALLLVPVWTTTALMWIFGALLLAFGITMIVSALRAPRVQPGAGPGFRFVTFNGLGPGGFGPAGPAGASRGAGGPVGAAGAAGPRVQPPGAGHSEAVSDDLIDLGEAKVVEQSDPASDD